jgi:hypothetical protein
VRTGLDGVPGLAQELAGVADAFVDRFWPYGEQGGDGDLGQGQAVVKDGGQEPVGDQGVPVVGRQAGQRWMAEPGQVGTGLVKRVGSAADLMVRGGVMVGPTFTQPGLAVMSYTP